LTGVMTRQIHLPLRLSDSASFENFLTGSNGQVLDVLGRFGSVGAPQMLYLHGPPGCGKSHLLHACCRSKGESIPLTVYVPTGVDSVGPQMLSELDPRSMVCVDDVEHICADRAWEEALLDLYEQLQEAGGCLLVAGRYPPAQAGFLLADLATRLASGGVWTLYPLSEAQLPEAMRLRARLRGLELPEAVSAYLLRRVPRDPATLFALLDQIDEQAFSEQRRLSVPFVREFAIRFLGS